jgi:hypothetical protein
MKKVLLLTAMLFSGMAYSQTVNGVALKDLNVDYVMIVGQGKLFSNKVSIEIDFGQETSFWKGGKEMKLLDENGKKVTLNSMIDALNFMSAAGYEFVNAYAITVDSGLAGKQNVYHYVLKKKIKDIEELTPPPIIIDSIEENVLPIETDVEILEHN